MCSQGLAVVRHAAGSGFRSAHRHPLYALKEPKGMLTVLPSFCVRGYRVHSIDNIMKQGHLRFENVYCYCIYRASVTAVLTVIFVFFCTGSTRDEYLLTDRRTEL